MLYSAPEDKRHQLRLPTEEEKAMMRQLGVVQPPGGRVTDVAIESMREELKELGVSGDQPQVVVPPPEAGVVPLTIAPEEMAYHESPPQACTPPADDLGGFRIPDHLQGAFSAVLKECEEKGFVQLPPIEIRLPGPDCDLMRCGCGWQGKMACAVWQADGWPHCPTCDGRLELARDNQPPSADASLNVKGEPTPNLVTAPDEQRRCCVLNSKGERCPNETRFWVGVNPIDEYAYVCADHLEDVRRPGDEVREIGKSPADEPKTISWREWL